MPQPALASFIATLTPGPAQSQGRLVVIPLLGTEAMPPEYCALTEALAQRQVEVTEISADGSVPELAVTNRADIPVLLLDGEELAGAKQNRVLNTSILVDARSKIVVPVSCTEHGRWNYLSAAFAASGNMMSPGIRKKKGSSVSAMLKASGKFSSDQEEVWDEIAALHHKLGSAHKSATGAMSDAYAERGHELEKMAGAFAMQEGQTGLLVLRDGQVEGCDVVSRLAVYRHLHDRLVRSYAMDALAERPRPGARPAPDPLAEARGFLQAVAAADTQPHKSPGLGEDLRLSEPQLVGSALEVKGRVVHLAAFAVPPKREPLHLPIVDLRRRRRFRSP